VQRQITTPMQVPTGLTLALMLLGRAPACQVAAFTFQPWPDGSGGYHVATLNTGEVLEAHDAAVAATLQVAHDTGRLVHVFAEAGEVLIARLVFQQETR